MKHKEPENPSRPISTRKWNQASMQNLRKSKRPAPDGFSSEFYWTFKDDVLPVLLKFSPKLKTVQYFLTHFMWPTLPWCQNLGQYKQTHTQTLRPNISDRHRCENPKRHTSKSHRATHWKGHITTKWGSFQGRKAGATYRNPSTW